ncbi:MAG TPA: hypothetical protein VKY37_09140 [Brumimicrobium sp.]|nr:hypothetical protein [Brumimicrobium sp.]
MLRRSFAIRNGLILFGLLGIYFLILDALGLADQMFLRFLNYAFIIGLLNNTIKHAVKNGENYLNKLFIGIVTVFIGLFLSIVALYIYLQLFEFPIERYQTAVIAASTYNQLCGALFIEGLSSSIILVFILLQFYKNKSPREVEV